MASVVVMLLAFHTRIRCMLNQGFEAVARPRGFDALGQLIQRELFRELVEDSVLPFLRRVLQRNSDAGTGVADVEIASRLPPLAVDGQGESDGRLCAEPIERCSPDRVVVEPRDQARVPVGLRRPYPINNTLVQVSRAELPDPACEVDVVTVMDL